MTSIGSRLPRFCQTTEQAPPLQFTERDTEMLRQVALHRFLRSRHLVSLAGGSPQQVLRRLQLLFHHGYLERPRCQLDYYHQGGSRGLIYGLGSKGAAHLRRQLDMPFERMDWTPKNRSVGRVFLEHALMVSDFMVSLEMSCLMHGGVKLLQRDDIPLPDDLREKKMPFAWSVHITGRRKVGIIPDAVFGLEYLDKDGRTQKVFYFLEADRATMPIKRDRLECSSVFRKFLAYEATWSQGVHRSRFGWNRFRVLTLTASEARVRNMIASCNEMERVKGLFLFGDVSSISALECGELGRLFQDVHGNRVALFES